VIYFGYRSQRLFFIARQIDTRIPEPKARSRRNDEGLEMMKAPWEPSDPAKVVEVFLCPLIHHEQHLHYEPKRQQSLD
jgi:hypothetical protein